MRPRSLSSSRHPLPPVALAAVLLTGAVALSACEDVTHDRAPPPAEAEAAGTAGVDAVAEAPAETEAPDGAAIAPEQPEPAPTEPPREGEVDPASDTLFF